MLTTAQVKEHLRIEHDDEDDYIDNLTSAAYSFAEKYTDSAILDAEKVDYLDDFEDIIYIKYSPVQSITSIAYNDADSNVQSQTDYYLDSRKQHAILKPLYNGVWPITDSDHENVVITYQAGYATIPDQINQAVLLIVSDFYENRNDTTLGISIQKTGAIKLLLNAYKIYSI